MPYQSKRGSKYRLVVRIYKPAMIHVVCAQRGDLYGAPPSETGKKTTRTRAGFLSLFGAGVLYPN